MFRPNTTEMVEIEAMIAAAADRLQALGPVKIADMTPDQRAIAAHRQGRAEGLRLALEAIQGDWSEVKHIAGL